MGLGMLKIAVSAAVALLVIAVIFALAPAIGGTIEEAQPTLAICGTMLLLFYCSRERCGFFVQRYLQHRNCGGWRFLG